MAPTQKTEHRAWVKKWGKKKKKHEEKRKVGLKGGKKDMQYCKGGMGKSLPLSGPLDQKKRQGLVTAEIKRGGKRLNLGT